MIRHYALRGHRHRIRTGRCGCASAHEHSSGHRRAHHCFLHYSPSGIGTVEELMEVWTMNRLSEIDKPVGLLNTAGFFAAFLGFIDHMVDTKFLPAAHRHSISVDADASALIDKLHSHARVDVPKWL
ncbi:LOG family protein [Paraburkholderia dipogonis]|uniref:LOG family protein n=1 Tax=Paraburkholderia dipogonis TaxID=1211383 RepID=UPI0038B879A1